VVIPCYRSAPILPDLVKRLHSVLQANTDGYEIVLVVDGSPDNTWTVAESLALAHPGTRALRLARNYGEQNATIAGIRAARHDVIVTMDDDLQHPPEEIPRLLSALTSDVDLVYGLAGTEEHGVVRSFAARTVKAGVTGLLGVRHARTLSSFRAFRAYLSGTLDDVRGPNANVDVALSWGTTRIYSVTVAMKHREVGRSGYTFRTLVRHTLNLVLGYSILPLRLVTFAGIAVALVGIGLFGYVVWEHFNGPRNPPGFAAIASMISVFSATQMIAIGVLGEYLGRIFVGGMGRPTYVVRDRVEAAAEVRAGSNGAR
jgi:undecaprenyl-phosphate 4-deoxy-4-formamido-L-arabinose transferase